MSGYFTVPELAEELGRNVHAVRRAVDRLRVAVRIGPGYRLVPVGQVEAVRADLKKNHTPRRREVSNA